MATGERSTPARAALVGRNLPVTRTAAAGGAALFGINAGTLPGYSQFTDGTVYFELVATSSHGREVRRPG